MTNPEQLGPRALLARTPLHRPLSLAKRYVTSPRRARHDLAIAADLRDFRRSFGFFGGSATVPRSGRDVLVISLSELVAQLKTESLLAKALELRGLSPAIVTQSWQRHSHAYYRVFGFDRLLYFDEHRPQDVPPPAARELLELFASRPSFAELGDYRYRGIEVGRQALATLLRRRHQGRLELEDPATREDLRDLLLSGVRSVEGAEALLDRVRPQVALVNDAMYVGVGAIFEGALRRRIPVIQWLGSPRDDAFALRRFDLESRRVHPFSLSDATWERVRQEHWTAEREAELRADFEERYVEARWRSYYNKPLGEMLEVEEIRRRLGLDPAKKTAIVFAHILWDSTLFWGHDLFEHYEAWLVETARAACANPAVNWVIKSHPGNVWKLKRDGVAGVAGDKAVLEEQLGGLPGHVKFLPADGEVNTFALFGLTDYCLTVRGTIGIEMAAFGIPVLTAGTGRYSHRGFTVDSETREEYLGRLARIQDEPPLTPEQVELAKRYAHGLFVRRPARFETFRWVYKGIEDLGHPLDHNVAIQARSLEEFARARDIELFCDWALRSKEADFLMPQTVSS